MNNSKDWLRTGWFTNSIRNSIIHLLVPPSPLVHIEQCPQAAIGGMAGDMHGDDLPISEKPYLCKSSCFLRSA